MEISKTALLYGPYLDTFIYDINGNAALCNQRGSIFQIWCKWADLNHLHRIMMIQIYMQSILKISSTNILAITVCSFKASPNINISINQIGPNIIDLFTET